ncbi:hypothetical protein LUZ60_010186 [Juncus effusus]|nr:hypothetical protein LUZ60_010186 [Juncus effusus]
MSSTNSDMSSTDSDTSSTDLDMPITESDTSSTESVMHKKALRRSPRFAEREKRRQDDQPTISAKPRRSFGLAAKENQTEKKEHRIEEARPRRSSRLAEKAGKARINHLFFLLLCRRGIYVFSNKRSGDLTSIQRTFSLQVSRTFSSERGTVAGRYCCWSVLLRGFFLKKASTRGQNGLVLVVVKWQIVCPLFIYPASVKEEVERAVEKKRFRFQTKRQLRSWKFQLGSLSLTKSGMRSSVIHLTEAWDKKTTSVDGAARPDIWMLMMVLPLIRLKRLIMFDDASLLRPKTLSPSHKTPLSFSPRKEERRRRRRKNLFSMDLDPEGIFRDDSDSDEEFRQEKEPTKDLVAYLVDASPKMFTPVTTDEEGNNETHFSGVINCLLQAVKTQIIGGSNDEIAIVFFNTKEKKNLQDLEAVYVFTVEEREALDKPTARLIKELSSLEDDFLSSIGSRYGITAGSRENSLYNAIWVAQALLRKGSAKTASKRMVLFTNEDDPFGTLSGVVKTDMIRTTVQRAKDAQDLGILIELLPLSRPNEEFNVSIFYKDLLGLEGDELAQFLPLATQKMEDMTDQLRKRIFKKRKIKTLNFILTNNVSIEVNTYALIRPTLPGAITWLDSMTNIPLKAERSFICNDTGALFEEPPKRFHPYNNEIVTFSERELSEVKKVVSTNNLRLVGFKPLDLLKDYHNLKPSTFVFPNDEDVFGSTRVFISLHKSMLRHRRFALAFYGSSSNSRLVALVAQEELTSSSGQVEPPGMHMIYLPYSDDIRHVEEIHTASDGAVPCGTVEQIKKASVLMKKIDLKDFSVCQFANPALQTHYGALQVFALGEDEMPDIKDETLPDEEGLSRPRVVKAIEDLKTSVYGENHDEEEQASNAAREDASKKRKAIADRASKESESYDWADLAENGKLKDLTVVELKYYLAAHNLPVTGKKEVLISRILTHLGK